MHGWQLAEARREMSRKGGAREAGEGGGGVVLSECGRARVVTSTSRISPLKNGSRPQCDRPT